MVSHLRMACFGAALFVAVSFCAQGFPGGGGFPPVDRVVIVTPDGRELPAGGGDFLRDAMAAFNLAEDTTAVDSTRVRKLGEIEVTGSRTQRPISQVSKEITILTAEEIKQSAAQSVQELLTYLAGVDVQQRGAGGAQADVSIRGGSYNQTAVLLNGVNMSSPHTGHYSFDLPVNLDDIERIEVLHGPSAFIYGASAFSGAINIVTKKETDEVFFANLEGGKHGFLKGETALTLHDGITTHRISVNYRQSDGYMKNTDYVMTTGLWQSYINWGKSDLNIQAGFNDKKLGASSFYSARYNNQYEKTLTMYGSAVANVHLSDTWKLHASLYGNRHWDMYQLVRDQPEVVPYNYHRSDIYGATLNLSHKWLLGNTTLSADLREEAIKSSKLGDPMRPNEQTKKYQYEYDRANLSYMLQHEIDYEDFTLTGGALVNHLPNALTSKWNFYPTVGLAYHPMKDLKFFTTYSQAGRTPTFTDLFYTQDTHVADRTLKSEKNNSLDVGMEYRGKVWGVSLAAFTMSARNLIDWVYVEGDGKWHSVNQGRAYKQGFDIGASLNIDKVVKFFYPNTTLRVDYARLYQDAKEFTDIGMSGYVLTYLRDKFTAHLNLPLYKDKLITSFNYRWQNRMGTYAETVGNATEYRSFKPFSTLDMKAQYNYNEDISLHVNVQNLFNTNYFDLGSYLPQPGLWWTAGVTLAF